MDKVQLTKAECRLRQWSGIITDCRGSGKTVSLWCAENGINVKTYYYWLRKVREKALGQSGVQQIVPISPLPKTKTSTKSETMITVTMGKATVEISEETSVSQVEAILSVLSRIC